MESGVLSTGTASDGVIKIKDGTETVNLLFVGTTRYIVSPLNRADFESGDRTSGMVRTGFFEVTGNSV